MTTLSTIASALRDAGGGKVILVFGCGGERDKSKRAPMGRAAARYADYTIITTDNSRGEETANIIRDILEGHDQKGKRKVIVDREKAIIHAVQIATPGDIVLLAGKGHEQYEIKNGVLLPFNERKIALKALSSRKKGHTTKAEQANEN